MDGLDATGLVTFHYPPIFILSDVMDVMDGWMDVGGMNGWTGCYWPCHLPLSSHLHIVRCYGCDGWMDGGQRDGWMDGHCLVTFHYTLFFMTLSDVMDGWVDGWMVMALSPSTILSSS